jgi:hypothetical protein
MAFGELYIFTGFKNARPFFAGVFEQGVDPVKRNIGVKRFAEFDTLILAIFQGLFFVPDFGED